MTHFPVPSFFQQAHPTPSCTSKPLSVLSNPASPFFWHFSLLRPPRQLPSLAETCVCLGKASSSSPVTFLLCLGPDIPGSSSTAVIRPPFRALFDPNVIQSQRPWNSGLWDKVMRIILLHPEDAIPDVDKIDKFFMVLTLIGLHPDLEICPRSDFLLFPLVPSLDDVFASLLRLSSTQTLSTDGPSDSSVLASQTNSRGGRSGNWGRGQRPQLYISLVTLKIVAVSYMDGLLATAHIAQSSDPLLSQPDSAASSTSQSITLTVSFSWPWILDSGASDQSLVINTFLLYYYYLCLTYVTLANGSQTMAKGIGLTHPSLPYLSILTGVWGRRLALGVSLKASTPYITFISCSLHFHDAPLLIHNRLGHPSLSKFQKMVLIFPLCCRRLHVTSSPAKATKCIFLGYSRLQKRYHCYSPNTHRYFLSANVTFFEDSPFFSSSKSLPIFEVLPLPYISPLTNAFSRPLQVYHRRHRAIAPPLSSTEAPDDSPPVPLISPTLALSSTNHLPIALQKGNRSTRNPHPIYNFLSYHRLSSFYSVFVSTLSFVSLPKSTSETLSHPEWRQAMVDEMAALHSNGTWDLVSLPPDCFCSLISFHGSYVSWPLYQLDIKNVFLHGELLEEVYMEQPPDFVAQGESDLVCKLRRSLYGLKQSPRAWFGRFSSVVQKFGMLRSEADHSVFYHHNSSS
ncbi:Retrovirus-related Pol polyprotein from transposon TNT 1-94 [Vitis vinifera]|uniref:Retrovirus-related Pol polyprotein from transposon TNT 1-94 n=1 Tax=Vitis vinifera TaxID=29760 RepID=A0A438IJ51_VITVI|nr:Retrovirus-related Pol polyprotein from transposon TNT 1-94 [Vitis vinifera]